MVFLSPVVIHNTYETGVHCVPVPSVGTGPTLPDANVLSLLTLRRHQEPEQHLLVSLGLPTLGDPTL
jgi:hypothetical protein